MDCKKEMSIRISSSFSCLKLIERNIVIIFILTAIDSYECNILLKNLVILIIIEESISSFRPSNYTCKLIFLSKRYYLHFY